MKLKERKFKYRKLKKIQKLTEAKKYSIYNFSYNMLENYYEYFPFIVFSEECRFANYPDSRQHWLLSNDFREKRCGKYSKFPSSTMEWGAIGIEEGLMANYTCVIWNNQRFLIMLKLNFMESIILSFKRMNVLNSSKICCKHIIIIIYIRK